MSVEIRVPSLPESVADATLVAWRKKPGDAVARDENLVDLETDKVVLEVPSPVAGILTEIRLQDGATVKGGQVIALIEPTAAGEVGAAAAAAAAVTPAAGVPAAAAKLSPAAKRIVAEQQVNPADVTGSGRGGRISKADVVGHLAGRDAVSAPAPAPTAAPAPPPAALAPLPAETGKHRRLRHPMLRESTRRHAAVCAERIERGLITRGRPARCPGTGLLPRRCLMMILTLMVTITTISARSVRCCSTGLPPSVEPAGQSRRLFHVDRK